jgi:dTDP-glucose pyrophosphorylase/predicted transcriptional regulator
MSYKSTFLGPNNTIEEAIRLLNSQTYKIILVVNSKNVLLGTLTDGDIRRAIINHQKMSDSIKEIMSKNPITATNDDSNKSIIAMMKKHDVMHIPVIDEYGSVVELETLQDILNKKNLNPVLLMAGGLGKRLHPLTNTTPKPLLEIGGKAILETILERFISQGFFNFFISAYYLSDQIQNYFGDGSKWGVNISYIIEEKPLGTAGVLGMIPNDLGNFPLIMMNGDLLTDINFQHLLNFHKNHDGVATVCVRNYDFQVPFGVVESEDSIIKDIIEKPVHNFFVNAGIYAFDKKFISGVVKNSYLDMPELIKSKISNNEKVNLFPIHENWEDIGSIEQYTKAQRDSINE